MTIYDPLTHLPFPGNIIPASRINPVAANILKYLPLPQVNVDNGSNNYTATAQIIDYFQQEYTGKVEHKFTDKVSLTGFYLYNHTNEPCSDYFEPGLNGAEPLRRSERLPAEAAAADPGAQQHLDPERHVGAVAAVRLHPVRRQQHDDRSTSIRRRSASRRRS